MANCIEQGFVKGTKEYDDCVKARREEKVSSIVNPLLVKEKDNGVERDQRLISRVSQRVSFTHKTARESGRKN